MLKKRTSIGAKMDMDFFLSFLSKYLREPYEMSIGFVFVFFHLTCCRLTSFFTALFFAFKKGSEKVCCVIAPCFHTIQYTLLPCYRIDSITVSGTLPAATAAAQRWSQTSSQSILLQTCVASHHWVCLWSFHYAIHFNPPLTAKM